MPEPGMGGKAEHSYGGGGGNNGDGGNKKNSKYDRNALPGTKNASPHKANMPGAKARAAAEKRGNAKRAKKNPAHPGLMQRVVPTETSFLEKIADFAVPGVSVAPGTQARVTGKPVTESSYGFSPADAALDVMSLASGIPISKAYDFAKSKFNGMLSGGSAPVDSVADRDRVVAQQKQQIKEVLSKPVNHPGTDNPSPSGLLANVDFSGLREGRLTPVQRFSSNYYG